MSTTGVASCSSLVILMRTVIVALGGQSAFVSFKNASQVSLTVFVWEGENLGCSEGANVSGEPFFHTTIAFPSVLSPLHQADFEPFTTTRSRSYFYLVQYVCIIANGGFVYDNQENQCAVLCVDINLF